MIDEQTKIEKHAHEWRLTGNVLDSLPPYYCVDCSCGQTGTVTEEQAIEITEGNKPNPADVARREFEAAAKKVEANKRWSK